MIRPLLRGIALAVALLAATSAFADPSNPLTDKFSMSLGTYLLNTETTMRVDGQASVGSEVNLERDLGFDDQDRFRLDGYWRMTPRQKLRIMYFDNKRSSTETLSRTIVIDGVPYPINGEVTATSQQQVLELAYEFAFLRGDKYEVTATGGIHNIKFDFGIRAVGTGGSISGDTSTEANGPMPVIGARGVWRISEHFYADAAVQFFKISLDPYDGRIEDYNAALVWQPFDHVGFGLGYNGFVTKVDVSGDNFHGQLKWQYDGARIFVTGTF